MLENNYLSIADIVFSHWDISNEWNSEVAALLGIMGTLTCNSNRRLVSHELDDGSQKPGTNSQTFKAMHAPPIWNSKKISAQRLSTAKSILPYHLIASSNLVIADYISFSKTISTLPRFKHSPYASEQWIKRICSFSEFGHSGLNFKKTVSMNLATMNEEDSCSATGAESLNEVENRPPEDVDEADCRQQNAIFLQTIEEYDSD